jgi:hypothetical protein
MVFSWQAFHGMVMAVCENRAGSHHKNKPPALAA